METKFASLSGKILCKVGHAPRLPKGINTTHWAPKRVYVDPLPPQDREEGDWIDKGALIGLHLLRRFIHHV
jgi:hypothetical protein